MVARIAPSLIRAYYYALVISWFRFASSTLRVGLGRRCLYGRRRCHLSLHDLAPDVQVVHDVQTRLSLEAGHAVRHVLGRSRLQVVRSQQPVAPEGPRNSLAVDAEAVSGQVQLLAKSGVAQALRGARGEVEDAHRRLQRHSQQPLGYPHPEAHAAARLPAAIGRHDDACDALYDVLAQLLGAHVEPLGHSGGLVEPPIGPVALELGVQGEQRHALAQPASDLARECRCAADGARRQADSPFGESVEEGPVLVQQSIDGLVEQIIHTRAEVGHQPHRPLHDVGRADQSVELPPESRLVVLR
mmetsp:Transcript_13716/g.30243  ORF Transcript_13716/g.30243 Transcript_13716/m.30243 type:complete len:301 (+) Transcript_13716:1222-2124(+)